MGLSERETIIETVNKLFIYTDEQQWEKLLSEVFNESVYMDMTSLGADASNLSSREICDNWENAFSGLDAINHLAGNYLVSISENSATVYCYATATHYKADAVNGKTREFVGTYDLDLVKTEIGWRIHKFKYNLKYMNGNIELE